MAKRFVDHVVWITGGGTGIGKALALEFVAQGAKVAVSGRRLEPLQSVVAEIEAAGGQGLAVQCDVTSDDDVAKAVATVVEQFGQLDVAIANAGFGVAGRIEELSGDDWRRQFDVNVVGAALTARYALPELKKTQGRVVLIGSVAGFISTPAGAPYSASKYAVRALGDVLSLELHGSGVTCTQIHPGFVESEIARVDNKGQHHPDRSDPRPAKLMWPADRAAKVVVKAIARRKQSFVFTTHGKIGAFLGHNMPKFVHFVQTRMAPDVIKRRAPLASES